MRPVRSSRMRSPARYAAALGALLPSERLKFLDWRAVAPVMKGDVCATDNSGASNTRVMSKAENAKRQSGRVSSEWCIADFLTDEAIRASGLRLERPHVALLAPREFLALQSP